MKSAIKNLAIIAISIAIVALVVWLLPVKATLAIIFIMQLVCLLAIGGVSVNFFNPDIHEQKEKQEYHGEEEA